jgi:hypothetical protein
MPATQAPILHHRVIEFIPTMHTESPMESQYSFMLTSGRRVWLEAFLFEKTYAGLMAGYPKNQPGYITSQAPALLQQKCYRLA